MSKDAEMTNVLLAHPNIDVNRLDSDKISPLCGVAYGRNNKEVADLIMNHKNFKQTLEDFNKSREALQKNYLQPEHYEMNNPLVNYVRAQLSFREGNIDEAKKYINLSIKEDTTERTTEYKKCLESYDKPSTFFKPKEISPLEEKQIGMDNFKY